mmetsp:Transcript_26933/g.47957  ORF Transcript_26933/g.47957 Transcript_26933/m.47957 type:complete len:217 (+) Transcript_26933:2309-2959(+)
MRPMCTTRIHPPMGGAPSPTVACSHPSKRQRGRQPDPPVRIDPKTPAPAQCFRCWRRQRTRSCSPCEATLSLRHVRSAAVEAFLGIGSRRSAAQSAHRGRPPRAQSAETAFPAGPPSLRCQIRASSTKACTAQHSDVAGTPTFPAEHRSERIVQKHPDRKSSPQSHLRLPSLKSNRPSCLVSGSRHLSPDSHLGRPAEFLQAPPPSPPSSSSRPRL